MSLMIKEKSNSLKLLRKSPPAVSRQGGPVDRFSLGENPDPGTYTPNWAPARTDETRAKMSGKQVGAIALGVVGTFGVLVGIAANSGGAPPQPAPAEVVTEITQPASVSEALQTETPVAPVQRVVQSEPSFSEGRELLVDRSHLVRSDRFAPDPSQAVEVRGNRPVYEESYISSLLDRDLTEVPTDGPSFTAVGADQGQSSKLYFDGDLNPADWGGGTIKTGDFFTRPSRMNGRGAGIMDGITQHQLSCIYRLEQDATVDGVNLEAGLYRLVVMEPSSNVATNHMQRGVCPGHRLETTGSGISGDYRPTQYSPSGDQLRVNHNDIVQIWSLTAKEQASFLN